MSEQSGALRDVYDVCRGYGVKLTLQLNDESGVTRDKYSSIIGRNHTPVDFYAHPVEYNPTEKKLEQVGIRESVDVLAYFSMLEWKRKGYTIDNLDLIRDVFQVNGQTYKLVDKKLHSNFGSEFLYIVVGGRIN